MRRRLRRLCYGFEGPEYERSAGVYLARALLFGFIGLWSGAAAVLLVFSLVVGWVAPGWLAGLIGLGVLGFALLALVQGSVHPAHQRYALHHRRAGGDER